MSTAEQATQHSEPTVSGVLTELGQQWLSGARRLIQPRWWSVPIGLLLGFGVIGDAYTTLAMLNTGQFVEANVLALRLMNLIGVVPAVLLGSMMALALILPVLGDQPERSRLYAATIWWTALVITILKFFTVAENSVIWLGFDWAGTPWPWTLL